ncbi:MAG: hypothetical protein DCC75_11065, partial [Proteobacteria bacterium]
ALLKGLDFRRAAFLRFDNRDKRFLPAILLGLECEDFFEMDRSMQGRDLDYMPEAQAYMKGQPVFAGDPIFEGGFPFAAFPVIWKGKFHGVFYADMSGSKKRAAMNLQTQMGCLALAELWRSVPAEFN